MKRFNEKESGITLVALVVTMIVLLVLAGVTVQIVFGNNGLIERTKTVSEAARAGEINDRILMEAGSNLGAEHIGEIKKTRGQFIDELYSEGKLKDEEVEELEGTDVITIGGITVDFSLLGSFASELRPQRVADDFWILNNGVAHINTSYITFPDNSGSDSYSGGSYYGEMVRVGECQYTRLKVPSKINGENVLSFDVSNVNNIVLLDIQEGITSIPSMSSLRDSLQSVTIPGTVTSIGESCFLWCYALKEVNIKEGVNELSNYAFQYCTGLKYISIPSSVSTMGVGCFNKCMNLENVDIQGNNITLGNRCFLECTRLQNVKMAEGVTSLGERAFGYCSNLKNIDIPSSVISIGKECFYQCTNLESIDVKEGLTSIGEWAFYNCTNLESINIPSTVTSIGTAAFIVCSKIESIKIPDNITSLPESLCSGCASLKNVEFSENVTEIGARAFQGCRSLESFVFPNGVTIVKDYVLQMCTNLKEVYIPDGVTSINQRAFYQCTSLEHLYIPSSVSYISGPYTNYASFYECSSSLVLYCGASEQQPNWGTYWKRYGKWTELTVKYNYTREQYEAETNS
ncbi:MAG: leucine-rich repeat domain-containing protein [Clostridia bacterium]|nr:leucine-rich repeat domain-containing protein [Clostridia bacterium]